MFPALSEVNVLPASIQKSTHLCDIHATRKLKKNRQEQTQLLKRGTARLSSVPLISIQCFSEEIFISKDQDGQESNQTQANAHTRTHTHAGQTSYFLSGLQARDGHLTWQGQTRSQRNTHTGLLRGKQHRGEGTHTHTHTERHWLGLKEWSVRARSNTGLSVYVWEGGCVWLPTGTNHIGPSCPGLRSIL